MQFNSHLTIIKHKTSHLQMKENYHWILIKKNLYFLLSYERGSSSDYFLVTKNSWMMWKDCGGPCFEVIIDGVVGLVPFWHLIQQINYTINGVRKSLWWLFVATKELVLDFSRLWLRCNFQPFFFFSFFGWNMYEITSISPPIYHFGSSFPNSSIILWASYKLKYYTV